MITIDLADIPPVSREDIHPIPIEDDEIIHNHGQLSLIDNNKTLCEILKLGKFVKSKMYWKCDFIYRFGAFANMLFLANKEL